MLKAVTNLVSTGQLPAGTVLQVVSATTNTPAASTSTSFADTGLTATITPTKATSKILVIVNQNNLFKTGVNNGVKVKLLRGSTDISTFAVNVGFTGAATDNLVSAGVTHLDTPATTSSVTYKTQFAANSAGATVLVQGSSAVSSITLLEIA